MKFYFYFFLFNNYLLGMFEEGYILGDRIKPVEIKFLQDKSNGKNLNYSSENLLHALFSFTNIYRNGFWGEKQCNFQNDAFEVNKQKLLYKEMERQITQKDENIKLMGQTCFIAYPEKNHSPQKVIKAQIMRLHTYYGHLTTLSEENAKRYNDYRQRVWDIPYNEKSIFDGIYKESLICFSALITNRYSMNNNKLEKKEMFGLVGSYGFNAESEDTANYKKFCNKSQIIDWPGLKEFISHVMYTFIASAHKLTEQYMSIIKWKPKDKKDMFKCTLGTMQMGLGAFLKAITKEDDKKKINELYLDYLYEALLLYPDIKWRVLCCDIDQKNEYYIDGVNKLKKNNKVENIEIEYVEKSILDETNYYSENLNNDNNWVVLQHAGDQAAVFGNGGYLDRSYERCLVGYGQHCFLNLAHLYINFFLPFTIGRSLLNRFFYSEINNCDAIELNGIDYSIDCTDYEKYSLLSLDFEMDSSIKILKLLIIKATFATVLLFLFKKYLFLLFTQNSN